MGVVIGIGVVMLYAVSDHMSSVANHGALQMMLILTGLAVITFTLSRQVDGEIHNLFSRIHP